MAILFVFVALALTAIYITSQRTRWESYQTSRAWAVANSNQSNAVVKVAKIQANVSKHQTWVWGNVETLSILVKCGTIIILSGMVVFVLGRTRSRQVVYILDESRAKPYFDQQAVTQVEKVPLRKSLR